MTQETYEKRRHAIMVKIYRYEGHLHRWATEVPTLPEGSNG